MLTIRVCEACQGRIRVTGGPSLRPRGCPFCKAPAGPSPKDGPSPTPGERALWGLGLLTQALAVVPPVVLQVAPARYSMNRLGAGLVGIILAGGLWMVGRVAQVGSRDEHVGINLVALTIFYMLVPYGFFAFPRLDALGGGAMVLLATGAVIHSGTLAQDPILSRKAENGRIAGWLILLAFLAAYAYHALKPWL